MTKNKETFFDLASHFWRHRPGNEIEAAVLDVWDAIYKEGLRPLILKQYQTQVRWWAMIHLPPGMTFTKFTDCKEALQDATKGIVGIDRVGERITVTVLMQEFEDVIPYEWKPNKNMYLPLPLGYDVLTQQLLVKDLAKAPHLFIGGNTDKGKSNLLHNIAVSLLRAREIFLVIIDLKVLEFVYLTDHAAIITDEEDALPMLQSLNKELNKRLKILKENRVVKIQNYKGDMPRIVLMIDELTELQDEESIKLLNRLLRLGRAAGFSIVAATQRPSSTALKDFGDSKILFAARICFKMPDEINSRIVLDTGSAAHIPDIPGRCIVHWGKEYEVQTMFLPPDNDEIITPLLAEAKVRRFDFGNESSKRLKP